MVALKWFTWTYYGLAVAMVILAMVESTPEPLAVAIALCLGGVLLQALDLGLQLLKEIRDALVAPVEVAKNILPVAVGAEEKIQQIPTKTLAELQTELHDLKRKLETKT